MRRLAFALALALGIVLLGAPVAQAKAPTEAVVSGPGLDSPLIVEQAPGVEIWGPTDPVRRLCVATGLCGTLGMDPGGGAAWVVDEAPPGELGAVYEVDFGAFGSARVYSFAADGPWVEIDGMNVGWFQAGADLVPLLRELGVPVEEPTDPLGAPAVTAGIAAIVLVPLAILLVRRRRFA
ncbi:hypothetical protein [Tenggerimyces flavus]|uniref:Uncharacterized protein n=1 Tax=Tenggerimyces flavus TaxID=1708749 RepID=A0ABV7Y642_9ACTN|nr:hypothetical protein [Tenggerimyces flavus]MBM7790532.1 hypothetical protein [Tenggerimyces flavus]